MCSILAVNTATAKSGHPPIDNITETDTMVFDGLMCATGSSDNDIAIPASLPGPKPYYHCVSRCVRHAFLFGFDEYSGKSYEHRQGWVEALLLKLSDAFCIDIVGHAATGNGSP